MVEESQIIYKTAYSLPADSTKESRLIIWKKGKTEYVRSYQDKGETNVYWSHYYKSIDKAYKDLKDTLIQEINYKENKPWKDALSELTYMELSQCGYGKTNDPYGE